VARFRKKPVVIDAWLWDGTFGTYERIRQECFTYVTHSETPLHGTLAIETREGTMRADVGDWIIRGVAGEFYPCKPDIFAATYEPVED
jgi:hypothetical protein